MREMQIQNLQLKEQEKPWERESHALRMKVKQVAKM
jgi:hypothetical protein